MNNSIGATCTTFPKSKVVRVHPANEVRQSFDQNKSSLPLFCSVKIEEQISDVICSGNLKSILSAGHHIRVPLTLLRKVKSNTKNVACQPKSSTVRWSFMANTHWVILLLADLVSRHSLAFPCGAFAQLIEWSDQCDFTEAAFISDLNSGYSKSMNTALTPDTV